MKTMLRHNKHRFICFCIHGISAEILCLICRLGICFLRLTILNDGTLFSRFASPLYQDSCERCRVNIGARDFSYMNLTKKLTVNMLNQSVFLFMCFDKIPCIKEVFKLMLPVDISRKGMIKK